jgi:cytoskeletal protein CcmA (bactofilin family)
VVGLTGRETEIKARRIAMTGNRIFLFLIFLLISSSAQVSAADFGAGEVYALPQKDTVFDDLYAAGGTVTVAGNVEEDLVAAGGNVTVTGSVAQDMIIAGGTINISGSAGDDLRAAGGEIQFTGKTGDDAILAGGLVYLVPGSVVGGDVIAAGDRVILDAEVAGKVNLMAREVTINGPITGDVEIRADRIVIGENAVILGNFNYRSRKEAEIKAGSVIKGVTSFEKTGEPPYRRELKAFIAAWILARYLMLLTAALAAVLVFRKFSQGLVEGARNRFGGNFVTGFTVSIVAPVVIFAFFITVIGAPIGFAAGLVYVLVFVLSSAYAGVFLGSLVLKKLLKQPAPAANWKAALLGVTVYTVVGLVPLFGWLFKMLFLLTVFGFLSRALYQRAWLERY